MKLIFFGPPGVGKGTMAARAKDFLRIPHVSTGRLFRENVSSGTDLGKKVKGILEQGNLVPDEVTVAMVRERLGRPDAEAGFILDGFPRTIPQAEALAGINDLDCVVNFACSYEELIRRLTGRRQCPVCGGIYHIEFMPPAKDGFCNDDNAELSIRDDDKIDAVRNRLEVYKASTKPLIAWYQERGLLKDVDADQTPDGVFESVKTVLGK